MIQALIQNKEQTAVIKLPQEVIDLQIQLHQIGIRKKANTLPIADDENRDISIKLFADSDIGNHLALLFTENHTLADANRCVYLVKNTQPEIQTELEQNLLYDQYTSPQELTADIGEMTEKLVSVTVDYYCPLKFQMAYPDYNDLEEISNGEAQEYADEIQELVQREQEKDLNDMAFYFDGSEAAKAKIVSAVWDMENVGGELYGVIHTKLRSAFTSAEEA